MWTIRWLLPLLAIPAVSCRITTTTQVQLDDTYCLDTICRELNFPSDEEVASFEPRSDVVKTSIRFQDSVFTNFPLNLFLAYANISELDMRNCSIEHLTWENFLWAADLKVLLLSDNQISRIDESTFSFALNIQFLWLESNRIHTLVSESFKGLTQLKYLSLQDNRIAHLPDGMFNDLRNLEVVILAENKIKSVHDNLFSKCPKLMSIDLKSNRIHNISDNAFKDLRNLLNVDISHNKPLRSLIVNLDVSNLYAAMCSLRQVNIYGRVNFALMSGNRILELYFSQPEVLQSLDLKNNSLQQIASLTRVKNLNFLDLSDNPKLERVPDPWGVSSLQRLNLANTGLTEFPGVILGKKDTVLQLTSLDISRNSIRQIDPHLFSRMANLTQFYFHKNDWDCFYLRLMMELVIKPSNPAYINDDYDPRFPGEYIEGIKCMFRSIEAETDITDPMLVGEKSPPLSADKEIEQLRNELKTIVRFYESKFGKIIADLADLKSRMDTLTAENATYWQHITLTT